MQRFLIIKEDQLVLNTSNNYDFFLTTNKYQEDIKNILTGDRGIPYYYVNYTDNEDDNSDFYFVHFLYKNNTHSHDCSPMFDRILSPIIGRLKFNYLMRAKVNLYTRKS